MGAVVIDPKGDRALREAMAGAARASAKAFIEWSPEGPCVYNPYARGSDTEIADKALSGERFTEPHYLRQAQRYLGHVVRALRAARLEVSLGRLVEALDPDGLERLARTLPGPQADAAHAYLDALTARQRVDLAGVRDRRAIIAESDLGQWLDPATASARPFDLLEAATSGGDPDIACGVLRPRLRQPSAVDADAGGGDRAGPADDRGGAAGPTHIDAGVDR